MDCLVLALPLFVVLLIFFYSFVVFITFLINVCLHIVDPQLNYILSLAKCYDFKHYFYNTGVRQKDNVIKTFVKTVSSLQMYTHIMHINIYTTNKSPQVNFFAIQHKLSTLRTTNKTRLLDFLKCFWLLAVLYFESSGGCIGYISLRISHYRKTTIMTLIPPEV